MAALPIASPFPVVSYGDARAVRLDDRTVDLSVLHVQGSGALDLLAQAFGDGPRAPGSVAESGGALVAALRPDMAAVLLPPPQVESAVGQIAAVAGQRLTALDLSHGRALMALSGPHAAAVLARLCALDFGERAFPNRHAAQTSLAKVRALIVRAGEEATSRYLLAVDRSHGAYVWGALADAMEEFLARK
jgi:heterotetrameric sarcosine oxidase gamma subunit